MSNPQASSVQGWKLALDLLCQYEKRPSKADDILDKLPEDLSSTDRRICQFLFYGVIRHKRLIYQVIDSLVSRPPKPRLHALLALATFEILASSQDRFPKIVDFSVNQAKSLLSRAEANFTNAVLRKVPQALKSLSESDSPAISYSCPDWLYEHWVSQFGPENTLKLLLWNNQVPTTYCRIRQGGTTLPETSWSQFHSVPNGQFHLAHQAIQEGRAYIQDSSTAIAPSLVTLSGSEHILDLCAAPGGKSSIFAEKLANNTGSLTAVDLPSPRIQRLEDNLAKFSNLSYSIIEEDILTLALSETYDIVFLDAPCSNTGVIQRRPDVKWRLKPSDISSCASLQLKLLNKAATFLKSQAHLIYSTCSIEEQENTHVVQEFLNNHPNFTLVKGSVYYPWETNHDGCGAFLLKRND